MAPNKKVEHLKSISKKRVAMSAQINYIELFRAENNLVKTIPKWPNIYNIFKSLNKEVEYRTVYGMMSSQVHSDAGDIINQFIAGAFSEITKDKSIKEENLKEVVYFSEFMVHFGITTFLETLKCYAKKFNLTISAKELNELYYWQNLNLKVLASKIK